MNRIIYCECGNFIPADVQDMQASAIKKCIACCVNDGIEAFGALPEKNGPTCNILEPWREPK